MLTQLLSSWVAIGWLCKIPDQLDLVTLLMNYILSVGRMVANRGLRM